MAATDPTAQWVFLRGLARENAHWDDFPQRFAATIPNTRVHLLDLPGNGEFWHETSPTRLASTLELVRQRARGKLAAEGPGVPQIHLFSMSLGSMVATAWAHCYPQEIARGVLVNTSLAGFCPFYRRLSWRVWPLLLRIAATS
ncbi:MAG: hydrolase, alpha/beta fold family, partial [Proteobacteria bacterium]|nr:hydrolase, alpha/beta fold family [Pseudomonadota bacterium]